MKISKQLELLKRDCIEIGELIEEMYKNYQSNCAPVYDGIVDIDQYLSKSGLKILWILKEPHEGAKSGELVGSGWDYSEFFHVVPDYYKTAPSTWQPLIYATYGILNDFTKYEKMDYIRNKKEMAEIIRQIAFINVKKIIGHTTSNNSIIEKAYFDFKELLHKQIEIYNPDIIIGGGTMPLFYKELGIIQEDEEMHGSLKFVVKNKKLYISAYHPAQRKKGMTWNIYVNDIISIVESWYNKTL